MLRAPFLFILLVSGFVSVSGFVIGFVIIAAEDFG